MDSVPKVVFFVSAGATVAGVLAWRFWGWDGGEALAFVSVIVCLKFGREFRAGRLREAASIKLGSENLPPEKDVASVLVQGAPISDQNRKALWQGLSKARRASSCGTVSRTIPFQIVDRWGGTWELEAYEEVSGKRGFTIHRVCYAGPGAEEVAKCVGLEGENPRLVG